MDRKWARILPTLVFVLLALNALTGCSPLPEAAQEGDPANIAGDALDNLAADYATVCGGFHNSATAAYSKVGGGSYNSATVAHSVVSGGFNNSASATNTTIGGGNLNVADRLGATIGGGSGNRASGRHATVGGGAGNAASGYDATIGGGNYNRVGGTHATVGGGFGNDAEGFEAAVGGGSGNTASAAGTTIGGGLNNRVTGLYSTVGGGSNNTADGIYSAVPGGSRNTAAADYGFASGHRAHVGAEHAGAFLYADSGNAEFHSAAADEFAVRATGGVRFVTAIDSSGNPVAGVELAPGSGSWSSLSDHEAKENLSMADSYTILSRLSDLPISTWNYTSQDPSIRHIGPMAQDFYDAFGVGKDAKHISTVDADGIALVAIQGLSRMVQERDTQIAAQQKELTQLEARVTLLEQTLTDERRQAAAGPVGTLAAWLLLGGAIFAGVLLWRWV